MNVPLPDGKSATLKLVTHGITTAVENIVRQRDKALEDGAEVPDFVALVLLQLVESWTLEHPLTLEGLAATPERTIEPLWAAAIAHFRGEAEDPLPKK